MVDREAGLRGTEVTAFGVATGFARFEGCRQPFPGGQGASQFAKTCAHYGALPGEAIMKLKSAIAVAIVLSFVMAGLAACEKKGAAERAGEKIDETVKKAGDKIKDAVK